MTTSTTWPLQRSAYNDIHRRARRLLDILEPISRDHSKPLPDHSCTSLPRYTLPAPDPIVAILVEVGLEHGAAERISYNFLRRASKLRLAYESKLHSTINSYVSASATHDDMSGKLMAIVRSFTNRYQRDLQYMRNWAQTGTKGVPVRSRWMETETKHSTTSRWSVEPTTPSCIPCEAHQQETGNMANEPVFDQSKPLQGGTDVLLCNAPAHAYPTPYHEGSKIRDGAAARAGRLEIRWMRKASQSMPRPSTPTIVSTEDMDSLGEAILRLCLRGSDSGCSISRYRKQQAREASYPGLTSISPKLPLSALITPSRPKEHRVSPSLGPETAPISHRCDAPRSPEKSYPVPHPNLAYSNSPTALTSHGELSPISSIATKQTPLVTSISPSKPISMSCCSVETQQVHISTTSKQTDSLLPQASHRIRHDSPMRWARPKWTSKTVSHARNKPYPSYSPSRMAAVSRKCSSESLASVSSLSSDDQGPLTPRTIHTELVECEKPGFEYDGELPYTDDHLYRQIYTSTLHSAIQIIIS